MALFRFEFVDFRNGHLLAALSDEQQRILGHELGAMLWIGNDCGQIEGRQAGVDRVKKALAKLTNDMASGVELNARLLDAAIRYAQHDPAEFRLRNIGGQSGSGHGKHGEKSRRHKARTGFESLNPKTDGQASLIQAIDRHELVVCTGPAGSGKTWISVAMGLAQLERNQVSRLIIARPAVEAGEKLGFLPGGLQDKVDPYMRPIYDAAQELVGEARLGRLLQEGRIEVAPLAYLRGRTFRHAFAILDEAQNATLQQLRLFMTRMGEGTRMVVAGDPDQVDLPPATPSGLHLALPVMRKVPGAAVVELDSRDVVRHRIVTGIIHAFKDAGLS